MDKGFTLIELIVVTGIIILMSALTLPSYKSSGQRLALERSAHKITQDLRRAQEMAVSVKEIEGEAPDGYGIFFDLDDTDQYLLFADLNDDQQFDPFDDKIVEIISLENKIKLSELDPISANTLTITFVPPDPGVVFTPDNGGNTALITIEAEELESQFIQYAYDYSRDEPGHIEEDFRIASCDFFDNSSCSPELAECPLSFSASKLDPPFVYDWCKIGADRFSREYEKQETIIITSTQKTIQVNKAGLIAIE